MTEDVQAESKCGISCCGKYRKFLIVGLIVLITFFATCGWVISSAGLSVNDVRSYLSLLIEPPTSPRKLRQASNRSTTQPASPSQKWHPAVFEAMLNFNTLNLQLTGGQINNGGIPKDAIAAITNPKTKPVDQADDMTGTERVIGVVINGKARAYSFRILNRHEVINDELGGVPISVIFCPLCDSASVVDRRIDGRTLEFGVSGLLSNSNVLLYDRSDHALWSQVWMRPVSDPLVGQTLIHINSWKMVAFDEFKKLYPEATYVTKDTSHNIDYSQDPYRSYFTSDKLVFPVEPEDNRYPNKTRMVGVQLGDTTRAYLLDQVVKAIKQGDDGILTDTVDGKQIRLSVDEKQQVHVIEAPADAKVIHTFWFAWAAFYPQTQVFSAVAKDAHE